MAKAIKRKVRRRETSRAFNRWVVAPVIGESPRAHYRFELVDVGASLPFSVADRAVYLRAFANR
jgi:hypothetical protein